jgi:5'-nucleotidase
MKSAKRQILLTNDDGIQSPGLWAAAEALSQLGYVTVAAPRDQASGTGRSHPLTSDGRIQSTTLHVHDQDWTVYAVGGTPAQTVLHAVLEIMPERPDLVVSGINYGENVGNCITISGTVGAAMEGASLGIPALAVSLQLLNGDYLGYSRQVDFSTAAYFTCLFAEKLLERQFPADVDFLKLEVPAHATPQTQWRMTRMSSLRYFVPFIKRSGSQAENGQIDYRIEVPLDRTEPDSDVYALTVDGVVAVTPLSLDMTARVDLKALEQSLKGDFRG